MVRLYVTARAARSARTTSALAGPCWRDAFDFVDPADEPVIRKFFIDMIGQFSERIRKERGK